MRNVMTSILGSFIFASIAVTANAANFTDTSFGISIDIDDRLSKQPQQRDIQYFNSEDRTGSLMIKLIHDLSIVDFLDELRSVGYRNRRDGVFLEITGKPHEADIDSGRGLLMPVNGQIRGVWIRGVVGAYSGHDGQGFLILATAKPEHWASWRPQMKKMLESVRFVKVDHDAIVNNWEKRLKDRKLQQKVTSGAARPEFHLCSNGAIVDEPRLANQLPGYDSNTQQKRGLWRINVVKGAPYLIVRERREHELMLEDEGDNFLLNGIPHTITASELCK